MSFRPILATACIELIFFQRHLLSVIQILEYKTHSETFGFHHINSTISNNAGSMHKYSQTFQYHTRLYTLYHIFSMIALATVSMHQYSSETLSILEYLVNVTSMRGHIKIFNTNVLKCTSSSFLI